VYFREIVIIDSATKHLEWLAPEHMVHQVTFSSGCKWTDVAMKRQLSRKTHPTRNPDFGKGHGANIHTSFETIQLYNFRLFTFG
jgi:hypothetical protein